MYTLWLHCGSLGWQQIGETFWLYDDVTAAQIEFQAEYPRHKLYFGVKDANQDQRFPDLGEGTAT